MLATLAPDAGGGLWWEEGGRLEWLPALRRQACATLASALAPARARDPFSLLRHAARLPEATRRLLELARGGPAELRLEAMHALAEGTPPAGMRAEVVALAEETALTEGAPRALRELAARALLRHARGTEAWPALVRIAPWLPDAREALEARVRACDEPELRAQQGALRALAADEQDWARALARSALARLAGG
ncbi:MAG: hypothetical protein AB7N76_01875 [Planctomycetota bacterium]